MLALSIVVVFRLSAQLLVLLFNTFDSVEPIIPARGYVIYILRRMLPKTPIQHNGVNNILNWFPTIQRELESEEVLQLFPIKLLAMEQNILRHLRKVNDWLIQCTCLALLDKEERENMIVRKSPILEKENDSNTATVKS